MGADPSPSNPGTTSGPVEIDAALALTVTTPGGDIAVLSVDGGGREFLVQVDRPEVVGADVGRRDLGRMAELLAAAGLTARVRTSRRPLAVLGAGASSRAGTMLTGSARVELTWGRETIALLRALTPKALVVSAIAALGATLAVAVLTTQKDRPTSSGQLLG